MWHIRVSQQRQKHRDSQERRKRGQEEKGCVVVHRATHTRSTTTQRENGKEGRGGEMFALSPLLQVAPSRSLSRVVTICFFFFCSHLLKRALLHKPLRFLGQRVRHIHLDRNVKIAATA